MPPHRLPPPPCRLTKYPALAVQFLTGWNTRACLKIAFRQMCVTICGRFGPNEGGVVGYVDRMRAKSPAKWGVHMARMNFQTRSRLFNLIFRADKMSEEWRRSILVPIFKNKGDVQSCTNYRGIKLVIHTMKLWESH